jgi:hypothetical protein
MSILSKTWPIFLVFFWAASVPACTVSSHSAFWFAGNGSGEPCITVPALVECFPIPSENQESAAGRIPCPYQTFRFVDPVPVMLAMLPDRIPLRESCVFKRSFLSLAEADAARCSVCGICAGTVIGPDNNLPVYLPGKVQLVPKCGDAKPSGVPGSTTCTGDAFPKPCGGAK